jgi:hypothetical protein
MNSLEYVIDKINKSEIQTHPWEHLYIEDIVPQELYDDLKKYTLSCIDEDRIPDKRRHGYLLSHIDSDYLEDRDSVKEYHNIWWNDEVIELLKSKFTMQNSWCKSDGSQPVMDFFINYETTKQGAVYGIHTDSYPKLFTSVHYFANPNEDLDLGTGMASSTWPDIDWNPEDSIIAKYLPNSIFIFSPSPHPKMSEVDMKGQDVTYENMASFDRFNDDDYVLTATNHYFRNKSDKTKFRRVIQNHWLLEPMPRFWCGPSDTAYGPPNQFNLEKRN